MKADPVILLIAYVFGGLQAVAGGLYLGARFSRQPPSLSVKPPVLAGLMLGLTVYAAFSRRSFFPLDREQMILLAFCLTVHVVAALGCWALARLLLRFLQPGAVSTQNARD